MKKTKPWTIMILALTVAFGMFGSSASGASTRYAVITDVAGTVMATKAGGSKAFRVFKGMGLNEGDSIKVEKGSSVSLQVADHEDEIVLGENWNGVISKLKKNSAGENETAVKTWSGSMFSKVKKLTGSNDSYKVETPTAVMGVRGTHYSIIVDPVTGVVTMVVHSGQISVGQTIDESDSSDASIVLPAQQLEAYSLVVNDDISLGITYADLERLVQFADDDVIERILLEKVDIDNENIEQLDSSQLANSNSTLDFTEGESFQRYQANVENILFHLLDSAIANNKLADEKVQNIIDLANQQISDNNRQYDINREVPPLDPTAGVDPAIEQQRQQQRQQQQQAQQELQQQRQQQREQFLNQNQALLNQLLQQRQQQQQENQQRRQQTQEQTQQQFVDTLNEQQREQFEQNRQQIQQEMQSQEERRDAPLAGSDRSTSGGTGGSVTQSPSLTLEVESARSAEAGFDIGVKLRNFKGNKAVYGVQLHFIHESDLKPNVEGADVYYNSSKFASATTADSLRDETGTYNGQSVNETIYALTVFGEGTAVSFNSDGELLATIPFKGTNSGSVKLAYVKIVDSSGDVIATWSSSQLPNEITYSN